MNRKAHNWFTGALYPTIPKQVIDGCNAILDEPSATLGPRHRVVNHDIISASTACARVAKTLGRPESEGIAAANAHLLEDHVSDTMVAVRLGPMMSMKNLFDFWSDHLLNVPANSADQ